MAFIGGFWVLFPAGSVFHNFWDGVVKNLVMMTGEIDFGDIFSIEATDDVGVRE